MRMKLTIDDKEVDAEPGQTILEVARLNGIHIPTLCYHPALKPFGACRLCSVEIEKRGRKRIVTACNYPVEDGLNVRTETPEIIEIRKMLIELLLARCPGEKRIQMLAEEYGISKPRFPVEEEHCILCGLCARVCEELVGVSAINFIARGIERRVGTPYEELSDDCIGCGSCALVCPTDAIRLNKCIYPTTDEDVAEIEARYLDRGGERDADIGVYSRLTGARSQLQGQDGGMVTTLLITGIEHGIFDAALVVRRTEGYKSAAIITSDVEEIKEGRGTKYLRVPMIPQIVDALQSHPEWRRIGVVGTPCEVRAVRKLQMRQQLGDDAGDGGVDVTLLGLFCFESFDYEGLKEFTRTRFGIELDTADRTQISHGRFIIEAGGREYTCDVRELASHVREGCAFCTDFTSRLADISVGSVGTPDGYSTVIVRSKEGEKLLQLAMEESEFHIETAEVDKHELVRTARLKRRRAERNLAKILEGLSEE